jgi:hypothetical protein
MTTSTSTLGLRSDVQLWRLVTGPYNVGQSANNSEWNPCNIYCVNVSNFPFKYVPNSVFANKKANCVIIDYPPVFLSVYLRNQWYPYMICCCSLPVIWPWPHGHGRQGQLKNVRSTCIKNIDIPNIVEVTEILRKDLITKTWGWSLDHDDEVKISWHIGLTCTPWKTTN